MVYRHELYPKDILGTLFLKKPFIAEIALKAEFADQASGLKDLADVLAKFNVYVLVLNMTSRDGQQFITAFIDYSGIKGSLSELVKELKRVKFVLEVKYKTKKIQEKIIDQFATPTFNMGNIPVIIFCREEFAQVLAEIKKSLGTGGEALVYLLGFKLGRLAGEKYKTDEITEDFIIEDILSFQAFGWGVPEIMELKLSKPRIRLRFYELFECPSLRERTKNPCCHFFRGYLAGLFSKFLNKNLSVKEVKCTAMGDPYCEFIIEEK